MTGMPRCYKLRLVILNPFKSGSKVPAIQKILDHTNQSIQYQPAQIVQNIQNIQTVQPPNIQNIQKIQYIQQQPVNQQYNIQSNVVMPVQSMQTMPIQTVQAVQSAQIQPKAEQNKVSLLQYYQLQQQLNSNQKEGDVTTTNGQNAQNANNPFSNLSAVQLQ